MTTDLDDLLEQQSIALQFAKTALAIKDYREAWAWWRTAELLCDTYARITGHVTAGDS